MIMTMITIIINHADHDFDDEPPQVNAERFRAGRTVPNLSSTNFQWVSTMVIFDVPALRSRQARSTEPRADRPPLLP